MLQTEWKQVKLLSSIGVVEHVFSKLTNKLCEAKHCQLCEQDGDLIYL